MAAAAVVVAAVATAVAAVGPSCLDFVVGPSEDCHRPFVVAGVTSSFAGYPCHRSLVLEQVVDWTGVELPPELFELQPGHLE